MSTLPTSCNYRLESESQIYFFLNVSIEVESSAHAFYILINIWWLIDLNKKGLTMDQH